MKEIFEFRINREFSNLLFNEDEGKNFGTSIKAVKLTKDDPRFLQIPIMEKRIKAKYGTGFFFGWHITRTYTKEEIDNAKIFQLIINNFFEPCGEECGTLYDESHVCSVCGANRIQKGPLILKKGTIPKYDFSRTIGGEKVVSEKCAAILRGLSVDVKLDRVMYKRSESEYYQLNISNTLKLSEKTLSGINPFDLSESSGSEIYKCPIGHTIGLNLLTEGFVKGESDVSKHLFISDKFIGVNRGVLRPEPLYFCSPQLRNEILNANLKGVDFEVAYFD